VGGGKGWPRGGAYRGWEAVAGGNNQCLMAYTIYGRGRTRGGGG
jgi:hypothetical protein